MSTRFLPGWFAPSFPANLTPTLTGHQSSGTFSAPGVTPSVPYIGNGYVEVSLKGDWSHAVVFAEYSTDTGATWQTAWEYYGNLGATHAPAPALGPDLPREPGTVFVQNPSIAAPSSTPPPPTVFRLRCADIGSGSCAWTIDSWV